MNIFGLGVDIIEINRFKKFKTEKEAFLKKVFSKNELQYCFSFSTLSPHLAGVFAAKEAVVKALGANNVSIIDVEIRHNRKGKPEVYIKNKRAKGVLVSISHTEKLACAIATKL